MKNHFALFIFLLLTTSIVQVFGDSLPPQAGPENGGLQLRLVVTPHSLDGKEGYDVRVDLLNVTNHPLTLKTAWENDEGKGDLKEYVEAKTSIESYPAIAPWTGQIRGGPQTFPQSEYVLKSGESLSVSWYSTGRKLKNKLTNPLDVQNPEFHLPGLYSIHATIVIHVAERTVFLRSNEQLVSFGGSHEMPKHSYGTLWGVDPEQRTATLSLGSLHKIDVGDQFLIRPGMMEFWKLTVTDVYPNYSTGRIEPLLQVGPNPTNPNPSLPERNQPATLILQK